MRRFLFLFAFAPIAAMAEVNRDIYADEIFYDAKTGLITGRGDVSVHTAEGQSLHSDFLSLTQRQSAADVNKGEIFLSEHVRVTADKIVYQPEFIEADDMTYTGCWGCDGGSVPAWEFSADRMYDDRVSQDMYFYSATLRWRGLPILWLPYFSNPDPSVKRRSGLLTPKLGTTNNFGYSVELPVYVALSDYHDMTITPVWFEDENLLLRAEHRLNAEHSAFRTDASYTRNKAGDDRWHIFNSDRIELGDNALLRLNVNRTSDNLYLQEYGFYDAQPYLDTNARVETYGTNGYVFAEAHSFQELRQFQQNQAVANGDILPRIHASMQTGPIIGNSYLNLTGDFMRLSGSDEADDTMRLTGEVRYIYPVILPMGSKFEATLVARYDAYQFKNADLLTGETGFSGMKTRFLPSAQAAVSWPFVNASGDWTHIIEPKARVVVMNRRNEANFINQDSSGSLFTDASIFADNRYSGYDLWSDGTYADYGAEWSMFDNKGRSVEVFAGQSYDFYMPDETDPNSGFHYHGSDFVGRFKIRPVENIQFSNRFRLDRDNLSLRHLESDVRVGGKNNIRLGFMHAVQFDENVMLDSKFDEIIGGIGVAITDRLSVDYSTTYNITDSRMQQRRLGMIYNHPCYSIDFVFSDDRAETLSGYKIGSTSYKMHFNLKIQGP